MDTGNSDKPQVPSLVILSGLPGAGKTTFARSLAVLLPADHLESDAVRRATFPVPRYTAPEHGAVFRRIEHRAQFALEAGRNVVIDATNLVPGDRRRFFRLCQRVDARVVAVRITAPEDVLRSRLVAPRDGYSQAGTAVLEAMLDRARPFGCPSVVVDTRYGIEAAIDLVLRLVHDQGT